MVARQRQRVDAQPAWVLHTYPFRETSLIVEVFTRDHGRVALVARGARRPRSALRGLLLAFQPLEIGWAGKGEVQTLMKAEWQGGQPLLAGKALFCGYYLNELLMHLLPREDAHERLFAAYGETLRRFADGVREADLRAFEHALLAELGYGLTLTHDAEGRPIDADAYYAYEIERGAVRLAGPGNSALSVGGKTLLDMEREDFSDPRSLVEAKQLMRALMAHYLGGQPLETRKIFMELQEL
jgi:DNA repair protein RecO (recombination protein O)